VAARGARTKEAIMSHHRSCFSQSRDDHVAGDGRRRCQ